jgi:hypothetical protein
MKYKFLPGDLVRHRMTDSVGVIMQTPKQTGNGDYQTLFHERIYFTRERFLELIQKKS